MNPRRVSAGVVAAGMLMLMSVVGDAGVQRSEPSADTRQGVVLPGPGRAKVLAEMRQMLGSISGVLHALVANDLAAVEKAARLSGMKEAADPELKKRVPEAFLQLGLQTHKAFDELADHAKGGATRDEVIKRLAGLSHNCVACHAAYRFADIP
jgi:cytochrome c556